jgi:hypothetical protein
VELVVDRITDYVWLGKNPSKHYGIRAMTYDTLRYHQVRQKSIHNCFQRREGVLDQAVYWRARSLEVDIHRTKRVSGKRIAVGRKKIPSGYPKLDGDWYVFHEEWDTDTTVEHLSGFLMLCASMHRAIPGHEVFTLFLDAKDRFHVTPSASQSAEKLDALLGRVLGADSLFRPQDLVAWAAAIARERGERDVASLRDAVGRFGWPTLRELRGKFVVVLTGPSDALDSYADESRATKRGAFLSAGIGGEDPMPPLPHVVFLNMNGAHVQRAADVPQGCISRAYYIDDADRWARAVRHGCHHIATNKVNSRWDPWAVTAGPSGFPFESIEGPTPDQPEDAEVGAVWAWSDDLWEESDSFYFHFRECPTGELDNRYDFYVTGANSHCEDHQKGGVLARESLAPDSPYFGVFRFGQKTGLRVQYRVREGKTTMTEPLAGPPGFEPDTLAFVRLSLSRGGTRVGAWGSVDGSKWTFICSVDFAAPLPYQGLGVSAHEDPHGAKFLFGVPDGDARPPFDRKRLIGPNRNHEFRGDYDWDGTRRWKVADFG